MIRGLQDILYVAKARSLSHPTHHNNQLVAADLQNDSLRAKNSWCKSMTDCKVFSEELLRQSILLLEVTLSVGSLDLTKVQHNNRMRLCIFPSEGRCDSDKTKQMDKENMREPLKIGQT
jgi:hypothetical protein